VDCLRISPNKLLDIRTLFDLANKDYRTSKKIGGSTITLIAKKNESNEWVVLSKCIDPPLPETIDSFKSKQYRDREYQKAGFWRKIWIIIRSQLGL